jgi:hypothetical protein
MLSLRDESFELLQTEAEDRGISLQELIRAVIIPDWVKQNNVTRQPYENGNNGVRVYRSTSSAQQEQMYQPTVSRIR